MPVIRAMLLAIITFVTSLGLMADGLDGGYPSLWESFDPGLQRQLDDSLEDLGLDTAVRKGELSVALVDITDPTEPRVAEVNGNEMLYAASLPKIAILMAAFVEAERGELTLTREDKASLTRMIRVSSNVDATRMLRRVGKEKLLDILQSDEYRLYDPAVNGGLWVGKEYGKAGAYHRDPLHNLSHGATAMQVARFYYLLETGQLVNPKLSAQMKSMLGKPGVHHKFVKGLDGYPGTRIFRKSGTWRKWHADSAIVESGGHKYIIVALAANPSGGLWLSRLIRPIHEFMVPGMVAKAPRN